MSISQSPTNNSGNVKSLLTEAPTEQESTSLLQDDMLSDLPIVDEVTISTAEPSLSSVISSSLQVVSSSTAEEQDGCTDCEMHDSITDGVCKAVDEANIPSSPKPLMSSEEELGEDDLVNLARSTDSEAEKWQSILHRKRQCTDESSSSFQAEVSLSPPFPSSPFASSTLASSQTCIATSPGHTFSSSLTHSLTSSESHTLAHILPQPINSNNSNSCDSTVMSPSLLPSATATLSIVDVPRKRAKLIKHGQIEVSLEGKNLWDEFYRRGTEMIVNRLGRRMFPGFAVAVGGLKPKAKYSMKVEMILADNHRFKFLNGRWLAVGNAEPQPLSETYIHPDSPNTGAFWMRHGVSFRKLKVTNNKEKPGNNALIHSMHKYYLRLIIDEEFKATAGQKLPPKNVLQMDFPETSFIAVTAYQNEEVTQLKITNNPFAKAFRENAAEMDWDIMYQQNGMFSPSVHPEMYGNHHMMHGSIWPPQSPMLPSSPLTSTLPPYSPLAGLSPNQGVVNYQHQYQYPPNMTPSAFPCSTGSVPAAGSYFQWPQIGGLQHRNTPAGSTTSQAVPTPISSVSSGPLVHRDHQFDRYTGGGPLVPASTHQPTHNTLPDFDSAFAASIGHN